MRTHRSSRAAGSPSGRRPAGSSPGRRPPAGGGFGFANAGSRDIDDPAEVVLALARLDEHRVPGVRGAVERGVDWVVGMQSRDGGWAAFDADNTRRLVEKLPFCDFGAVID